MTLPLDVAVVLPAAVLLAVVSGANDGSTILALSLPVKSPAPLAALLVLVAAIALIPLIVGMPVASTLLTGLVQFDDAARPIAVSAAVAVAIGVAGASSRRGLPTSLTLALVGALVGIGVGAGQTLAWPVVAAAVGIAAAAPVLAGVLGYVAGKAFRGAGHAGLPPSVLPFLHLATYTFQAIAYGANDGQKLFAVLLASGLYVNRDAGLYAAIGALLVAFAVGSLLGLRPVARKLGRGVVPARPIDTLLSQGAASTAVILSAGLGAPVSMTQSSAAALVGSGLVRGGGRIRWAAAARIAAAWAVTLPASAAIGVAVGRLARLAP
jgi:PiT family inorganic phosphate transporter